MVPLKVPWALGPMCLQCLMEECRALSSTPGPHPTAPGQPARTDDLAVIPASMVHPLAQQLNRRLGTIGLQGWHVQVIDEEDEVTAQGWSIHTLPPIGKGYVSPAPVGTRFSGNPGAASGKPSLTPTSSELLDLLSSPLPHPECPRTSHLDVLSLASLKVSLASQAYG